MRLNPDNMYCHQDRRVNMCIVLLLHQVKLSLAKKKNTCVEKRLMSNISLKYKLQHNQCDWAHTSKHSFLVYDNKMATTKD